MVRDERGWENIRAAALAGMIAAAVAILPPTDGASAADDAPQEAAVEAQPVESAAGETPPPPGASVQPPSTTPLAAPPQPPIPAAATKEPAADGTVSVVVAPQTPAARPPSSPTAAQSTPPPAGVPVEPPPTNAATDLLSKSLEPLDARQPAAGGQSPAQRLDSLYARPLPLLEALQRSGDPARRLWITQAYWKSSAAFARVRWATESIERLELIAPGADPHDRAALDVAAASAAADLADARAELVAAQQELVDLVRLPIGEPLPWPVDRPLAGPYQTHFDAIFANRPATGRIRAIDRMLPSKYAALESRASAVIAAERALAMTEADHAKGRRPIESVVAAHAALLDQQREFLGVMKAYNLDIAEYVMAVADLSVADDRFVSMLIGTPIQWRPTVAPTGLPAAPPQAAPGQSADGVQPADGILP